jgi:hypothetical protein
VIKRWQYGLFAVFAIGILTAAILAPRKASEPEFNGKKLSQWLDMAHVTDPASGYLPEEALRAIGTNGIPKLLEMIGAVDPPQPVSKFTKRIGFQRLSSDYSNNEALTGFRILGTNAVAAVPGLIDVCIRSRSASSVRCAVGALEAIGPAARLAAPALVQNFTHSDADVRIAATAALMRIGGQPTIAVPALTRALNDTNASVRWNAVVALQIYGSNARPAIPGLLKALDDPVLGSDPGMRRIIERTLSRAGYSKTNNGGRMSQPRQPERQD